MIYSLVKEYIIRQLLLRTFGCTVQKDEDIVHAFREKGFFNFYDGIYCLVEVDTVKLNHA